MGPRRVTEARQLLAQPLGADQPGKDTGCTPGPLANSLNVGDEGKTDGKMVYLGTDEGSRWDGIIAQVVAVCSQAGGRWS